MARVKRGVVAHSKHKKILKLAKGYKGRANSCYRIAKQRVVKLCNKPIEIEGQKIETFVASGCRELMLRLESLV